MGRMERLERLEKTVYGEAAQEGSLIGRLQELAHVLRGPSLTIEIGLESNTLEALDALEAALWA